MKSDRIVPRAQAASWLALTLWFGLATSLQAGVTPNRLRCEYLAHPLAIETKQPRLSWALESGQRGQRQSAWQILAATEPARPAAGQADLWDSGKVISDQSVQVPYAADDVTEQIQPGANALGVMLGNGMYDRGSQTANAMPLVLGLVEPGHAAALLGRLVHDVRSHGNQVTAGDVGFRFLVEALRNGGRSDVLFDLVTREHGPGYLDQLQKGATTLTEAWDADPASSQNHCMLGHVEEWFYTGLAGINPDPAAPGFKKILICPQPFGDVTSVQASYDSMHGRIASEWKRDADRFTLGITLPVNTTATVYVPAKDEKSLTESTRPIRAADSIQFLRMENGNAVLAVGSGRYRFVSRLK